MFLDSRLPDRFWNKCIPEPNSGCWLWLGCDSGNGYGKFWWISTKLYTHIFTYTKLIGWYDPALQLDHKCRNRICCNPLHLEPVTAKVNHNRGISRELLIARNRAKTHCPKGHEYTKENTIVRTNRNNARECRACCNIRSRKHV